MGRKKATEAAEEPKGVLDEQLARQEQKKASKQPTQATHGEQPKEEARKPNTMIAVPLDEAATREAGKGEVARYFDDYNSGGVSTRIDSPDPEFRPSQRVNEPLKEEHEGRNKMRWQDKPQYGGKKRWHKETRNHPVAERLDAEDRFEEMVRRRKEEIAGNEPAL
jgi:hypothetical protein